MAGHSRLMSIALAALVAAGAAVAAQKSGGKDSEKKSDGVVTDTAKATGKVAKKGAKATAGGAKKLGLGIKDAVTPGNDDKPKDKEKKK